MADQQVSLPSRARCIQFLHITCNAYFLVVSHITSLHTLQHYLRVSTRISITRCYYFLIILSLLYCCKCCQFSVHCIPEFLEFGATFTAFYVTYIQYRIGLSCNDFVYRIVITVHLLLLCMLYCHFKYVVQRATYFQFNSLQLATSADSKELRKFTRFYCVK
jgi:hypothetical protein